MNDLEYTVFKYTVFKHTVFKYTVYDEMQTHQI